MTDPIPDGKLVVTFTDGTEKEFLFKDIKTWKPDTAWLVVQYADKSVRVPIHQVKTVECFNNSKEYSDSIVLPEDHFICPGCGTIMNGGSGGSVRARAVQQ